jgi:putative FmdB family regulatory protein
MPLYEYQCDACERRFEVIQKFSDAPVDACRHCGKGPVRRLLSSPAIQFKGSGWYITDYSQKGKAPSESSSESGGAKDAKDGGGKTKADASTADTTKTASTPAASTPKADASS